MNFLSYSAMFTYEEIFEFIINSNMILAIGIITGRINLQDTLILLGKDKVSSLLLKYSPYFEPYGINLEIISFPKGKLSPVNWRYYSKMYAKCVDLSNLTILNIITNTQLAEEIPEVYRGFFYITSGLYVSVDCLQSTTAGVAIANYVNWKSEGRKFKLPPNGKYYGVTHWDYVPVNHHRGFVSYNYELSKCVRTKIRQS